MTRLENRLEIALEQAKGYRDTSKDMNVPKPFRQTARRLMREQAMEWRRPTVICIR